MNGDSVEEDMQQAVVWCRKAAGQGLAQAQYQFATMYVHGVGVERDHDQVAKCFQKNSKAGHGGRMFSADEGLHVRGDEVRDVEMRSVRD